MARSDGLAPSPGFQVLLLSLSIAVYCSPTAGARFYPSAERAMTVDEARILSSADYWYTGGHGHEWLRTFKGLEPFFYKNLVGTKEFDILSFCILALEPAVPAELASLGYTPQLCVDYLPVVVDMMTKRHAEISGIEWKRADLRDLKVLADESVDVALDKCTLDAMVYGSVWDPPHEVKISTGRYMREVPRVLKGGGIFLYITFRQRQLIRSLLIPDGRLWDMTMHVLQSEEGTSLNYGFVIRKKRSALGSEVAWLFNTEEAQEAARTSVEPEGNPELAQYSGNSFPVDPEILGAL